MGHSIIKNQVTTQLTKLVRKVIYGAEASSCKNYYPQKALFNQNYAL